MKQLKTSVMDYKHTVNNAQVIYQGVLGGLMIGATGGFAAPAATVELANLRKDLSGFRKFIC